jgi:multidrug efflux pump subunit AcrA (membrane-fusion protein)
METQVKKREWVKTAAIIFLAVLLVLTFFSQTIMNRSLPEAATAAAQSGTINAKIRGSGTVSANEVYNVTISQTRKIASVMVKVGQTVAAGDVLFTLEEQESDELKQAQTDLETQEVNYQKSLLSLSNTAAQSSHDVQKARNAYNDALAVYNQYSTMDSTKLAAALASAQVKLKAVQKQSTDAQQAYTDASSAKEYTDAQATVTDLQGQIKTLEASVADYKSQINDLDSGTSNKTTIQRQIDDKQTALNAAQDTLASDEVLYQSDYNRLLAIASEKAPSGSNEDTINNYAAAYAKDTTFLATLLSESDYSGNSGSTDKDGNTVSAAQQRAAELALAYTTITDDKTKIKSLEVEVGNLEEDLKSAGDTVESSRNKIQQKLDQADSDLTAAQKQLKTAQDAVSGYETTVKRLKQAASDAAQAASDQQTVVDNLTNASTAAETVKTTRQALEDLVFAQSLGSSDSVDLQAAKDAIAKQEELVKKLTANADNVNVTAKVGGVIGTINVQAGGSIGADSPLCTINETDRGYTLKISVTNDQAKQVKIGDPADLVNYWGGDITAKLESIANDPQNPGKNKLLVFRLSGDGLEPDTNLTLSIGQKSANYDTLVPNAAVRSDNNGSFVLVVVAKSSPLGNRYTATRVNVQVLASDDTNTAVSGLTQGDFVVTTSTKPIEAGTQVRLVDNG